MTRPNPLTDELSDEAKAELAEVFAEMRLRYPPVGRAVLRHRPYFWERP
jgi:hypothetical protein